MCAGIIGNSRDRTIVAIATGWFRSAPERDSLVVIVARSFA
jgi:hypothetical protein